jgi:hypothetical protein
MRILVIASLALTLAAVPVVAQETQFDANMRAEGQHIAESCGELSAKAVGGCVYTLATDSPFHVALGSLAPQNGFAFGLAFDEHYTPNESWRISWNADVVGTASGSWRGGAYLKLVHTPATSGIVVRTPGSTAAPSSDIEPRELPVVDVFGQAISLNTLDYFGPGPQSVETGRSVYGERQTVAGVSAVYPLSNLRALNALHAAVLGGVTARFIDIRQASSSEAPSIQQIYDDNSAPGLAVQSAFAEFREGMRLKPSAISGRLRFDYLLTAQQFKTSSDSRSSFNRWTVDLQHEIPLYRSVSSTGPRAFNGPNACAQSLGSSACPPVQWSRNREGSIGLRLLISTSTTSGENRVPFYLQRTLGGSDVNGEQLLASYADYRFRAPNVLALQESIEHSIWGPLGGFVMLEQGKVAANPGDLGFSDLATSTTVGLTLRAGGFPMVNLSFSFGGEGHHIIAAMSPTLLGGSSRPSLY